ncbi:MAG: hypothetical protein K9W44_16080 [Candidatus Lokiarchaeota archaeon]|nr:hypothetical protein [Candidatus Harpocratesius repetitus]
MERLSYKPIDQIHQIFKNLGFEASGRYQNYFRYNIITEPETTIIFGLKIPVYLPIQFDFPIELCSFTMSFYFRPRWLDEKFEAFLTQFVSNILDYFNYLYDEYPLNHDFKLTSFESEFQQIFKQIFSSKAPFSLDDNNSEYNLYQMMRLNLIKKDDFFYNHFHEISHLYDEIAKHNYFNQTSEFPAELISNFPYGRENLAIIYCDQTFSEYFIGEPSSISYWSNSTYKNIWIRFGLESHLILPLLQIKSQNNLFNINIIDLVEDWIDYWRSISNEIILFLKSQANINSQFLQPFSERKFLLDKKNFDICYGLFFPTLVLEGFKSFLKTQPKYNKLDHPPQNFHEILYLERLQHARFLFYQDNWLNIEKIITPILNQIDFEKFPNYTIDSYFLLAETSVKLKSFTQAINFLVKALDVAKLGQTSLSKICELHFKIMQYAYYRSNDTIKDKHEQILSKIISSLPNGKKRSKLAIQVELWYAEWEINEDWRDLAENRLLNIKNPGKYKIDYEIKVNYLWAQYFKKKNDLDKMWAYYEKNFKFSKRKNFILGMSYLYYVSEHFLQPNFTQFLYKGFQMLQKAADFFDFRQPRDLFKLTEILTKLIEICFQLHNDELAAQYQKQLSACHSVISFFTL